MKRQPKKYPNLIYTKHVLSKNMCWAKNMSVLKAVR